MEISLIVNAPITDCYGLNLLATQLKRLEHRNLNVRMFYLFHDFQKNYSSQVMDQLTDLCKNSDLIGISLLSSAFNNTVQIIDGFRKKIDCPVVLGGKHPTIDPEGCIELANMVCLGEGEDTFYALVENIIAAKPYKNLEGLWVRENGIVKKNPLRPMVSDLDAYLFPDYTLDNKYVLDSGLDKIRPIELKDLNPMREWYPTLITRGCPNFCTFCTNSQDKRLRVMRSRSADNVIQEVKQHLTFMPDTKRIFFRDDCITAMPIGFIEEFSQKWKREINLPCSCSGVIANSHQFKEKLELLADSGFISVKMGIQSGCERVRRKVFARVWETDDVIINATRILQNIFSRSKNKTKINYYMITDNPYETEDELVKSIRFTSRLRRPFSLSLFSLNFYPGTVLFNWAIRDGLLKNKKDALQDTIMVLHNTYLNKVFLLLRHLEIHPWVIYIMTIKKIYNHKTYQWMFNGLYKYFFNTDVPSREIKPASLRDGKNKPIKISRVPKKLLWLAIKRAFRLTHRLTVK
jgi:anaerobic magnesium-protoporphyrin IX monomethyl ester cyclase